MAILLGLETSTGICSVALHDQGKLIGSTAIHIAQSASSKLAVMVNDLLNLCGLRFGSIDGVAVSAGPGSYTGLRIGVSTAKGLCLALNVPLISINTLELLACQVISYHSSGGLWKSRDAVLCPMLDARRMEVYYLIADTQLTILERTATKIIDEQSFEEWLARGQVFFFGNGAEKCKEVIRHPNAAFVDGVVPLATILGEMAFRRFERKEFEDLSSFEPLYLKDFVIRKPKIQI